jgi:hypothetical protein
MDYPVADLVGRCFLRVCFWIDLCTSWAKKYHPPTFTFEASKAHATSVPSTVLATPALATPALATPALASPALDVQSTIARSSQPN